MGLALDMERLLVGSEGLRVEDSQGPGSEGSCVKVDRPLLPVKGLDVGAGVVGSPLSARDRRIVRGSSA